MSHVFLCEPFSLKHMSQMAFASGAHNFGALSVGIGQMNHGTLNLIIKTWPPAVRVELVRRSVQRRTALLTCVDPLFFVVGVQTGKRAFGAFVDDHALFFGAKGA